MSRSAYVYTISQKCVGTPMACFTVKYEAEDWAKAVCDKHKLALGDLIMFRYNHPRNGESVTPVELPLEKE